MTIIALAIAIGFLFGAGLYMLMHRNIVKLVIGLSLIGHAANLLLFVVGTRLLSNEVAIIAPDQSVLSGDFGDPLPQALILTAIVIGLGIQAFAIVLVRQLYTSLGINDTNDLSTPDID